MSRTSATNERGDVEVLEAEVVDFIDDHKNYEYEGKLEIPPYKKRRDRIGKEEKGGDFNQVLKENIREINSKCWRTKKSLAWDFYEPYAENGKEADLKWYFCTFCYANKPDNMKEGMTVMILYNKINTSTFGNHVVTAHKRIFHNFFLT